MGKGLLYHLFCRTPTPSQEEIHPVEPAAEAAMAVDGSGDDVVNTAVGANKALMLPEHNKSLTRCPSDFL